MIRGKWKPREDNTNVDEEEMELDDSDSDSDSSSDDEDASDCEGDATPRVSQIHDFEAGSPATTPRMPSMPSPQTSEVDRLAQSMTSLSLVPPAIRFGRGGKNGGFVHPELHNPQVSRGRGRGRAMRGRAGIVRGRGRGS